MNHLIFKLSILLSLFLANAYGQKIITNTCDSLLLTKVEYEKCKRDTAWNEDFSVKVNYIINYKTALLPKYRLIRRTINLPPKLEASIKKLKLVYDSILNIKLSVIEKDMDRNQKYVQPKAYLSSILSLQIFKFYPDVYAILLNDLHLSLNPRTTKQEKIFFEQYFNEALQAIPISIMNKLENITSALKVDESKINNQQIIFMFQGEIPTAYRKQCDIINFLLWME